MCSDHADVLVLGCGLIGTSIGLALTEAGQDVLLHDSSQENVQAAVARGAGRPWEGAGPRAARLAVAAVPPAATGNVLFEAQSADLATTYTHVSSVQSLVQADVERLSCDLSQIVGGHPLAGRELSGPQAADADLFAGRPWAVCASSSSSAEAVADVHALAQACGATPVDVDIDAHDATVARLSHLPQVAASALAGLLVGQAGAVQLGLSGPGLVDSTRLAAGDPELWTQILAANAGHVAQPGTVAGGGAERAGRPPRPAGSGGTAAQRERRAARLPRAGPARPGARAAQAGEGIYRLLDSESGRRRPAGPAGCPADRSRSCRDQRRGRPRRARSWPSPRGDRPAGPRRVPCLVVHGVAGRGLGRPGGRPQRWVALVVLST